MRFKIHSISDIITNSSSEVFLVSKDSKINKNVEGIEEILNLGEEDDMIKFLQVYAGCINDYNDGELCKKLKYISDIEEAFSVCYFKSLDKEDTSDIQSLHKEISSLYSKYFKDIIAIVVNNNYHTEFILDNPDLDYEIFSY